jgi:hypothetical protein
MAGKVRVGLSRVDLAVDSRRLEDHKGHKECRVQSGDLRLFSRFQTIQLLPFFFVTFVTLLPS